MNKKIRLLALVLTLVMMLGILPLSAFASESEAAVAQTEKSALDTLADKATGSPYAWTDYADVKTNLGIVNGTSGTAGSVFAEGHFGLTDAGKTGYVADVTGGAGPNKAQSSFIYANGEYQFSSIEANKDLSFMYSNGAAFTDDTKYILFSFDVKRGEAMKDGDFARLRMFSHVEINPDTGAKKNITSEGNFLKKAGEKIGIIGVNAGDFSTSLFTTVTFVYELATDTLTGYANGIKIAEKANFLNTAATGYTFTKLHDISWWYGNATHDGHYMSLNRTRGLFINDEATLNKCLANDTTPANGVFKIDGDYYLFENNFPVTGATKTVDGYTVVTEAKTGKIIKCYKEADTSIYYDRWDASDYEANGVKLIVNDYHKSFSAGAKDVTGYAYKTETAADGSTYYVIDAATSLIKAKYNIGTNFGDSYEITAKLNTSTTKYYSKLPTEYEEIKDENGVVTGYKTTTAPDAQVYPDLSYYLGLESYSKNDYTDGYRNLNIRIKAGAGLTKETGIIRLRYYVNKERTNIDENCGSVKIVNGIPHLYMSNIDCGILRSDVYTDITMRTYVKDKKLTYDLYINGVLLKEGITIDSKIGGASVDVENYRYRALGTYFAPNIWSNQPLLTWGATHIYNGDKVNNNTNPYNGTVMTSDGIYTYKNGLAVSLEKNVAEAGKVGLNSYSVTLGDKLGVNFYAALPAEAAKAIISVNGVDQTVNLKALAPNENGLYKISSSISSIEVSDKIVFTVLSADGKVLPLYTADNAIWDGSYICSVKDYATTVAKHEYAYGQSAVTAVKALLNYAAYAEKYFGGSATFETAYSKEEAATVTAVDAASIKGTVSAGAGAAEILGNVNLILNNATKIRIQLKGAATVTSNFDNVTYVENDGKYFIDILGIDAKNLDTVYELDVNGINVKISVLGVASVVANNAESSADFINLMKALYLYSSACEAL